eukprot:1319264-Amorphochlora_amoeboformis.AAC.1
MLGHWQDTTHSWRWLWMGVAGDARCSIVARYSVIGAILIILGAYQERGTSIPRISKGRLKGLGWRVGIRAYFREMELRGGNNERAKARSSKFSEPGGEWGAEKEVREGVQRWAGVAAPKRATDTVRINMPLGLHAR